MSTDENVTLRRAAFCHDVSAAGAEVLHLHIETRGLELLSEIVAGGVCTGRAGFPAVPSRVRKPHDSCPEPVYGDRRNCEEGDQDGSNKIEIFSIDHINPRDLRLV